MTHQSHQFTVPARADALSDVRHAVTTILEEVSLEHAQMLVLAIDECCSNIVKHRSHAISDDQIHAQIELFDDRIRIKIESYCLASEADRIKPREFEDVRPGGLGMHFIREIADEVYYVPSNNHPGSMTLVLEKKVSRTSRA